MKIIISFIAVLLLGFAITTQAQCTNDCFINITKNEQCETNSVVLEAITNGTFIGWFDNDQLLSNEPMLTLVPSNKAIKAVASGSFSTNLIVNGDFENGFADFTSDYDFTPMVDSLFNNGDFNITTNPSVLTAFVNMQDHTGNGGNMLIADASKFAYKALFKSQVDVVKGKTYRFALWATNVHEKFINKPDSVTFNSPNLAVYFDSTFINAIQLPQTISWNELTFEWVSDTTAPLHLAIKNLTTSKEENDFAIDDIQLYELATIEKSITLLPCTQRSLALDVFSPDGDGNYDTFPIEENGAAKIYNADGFLIQELQLPTAWDGYTNKNTPAPVGYYIIIINDSLVRKVSLMK